jgi:hypothetical protein
MTRDSPFPIRDPRYGPRRVETEVRADGSILFHNPTPIARV